jgi:hypothetical protein
VCASPEAIPDMRILTVNLLEPPFPYNQEYNNDDDYKYSV